jgi:hypothetical protein
MLWRQFELDVISRVTFDEAGDINEQAQTSAREARRGM